MIFNFDENLILENSRIRLEPLGHQHQDVLTEIAEKFPDLIQYSPSKFGTAESIRAYIDRFIKAREERNHFAFASYSKSDGQCIGSTAFLNFSIDNSIVEIGSTWISKDYQRTGLNRHAKFLMMRYAFEVCQVRRLEFRTDERNLQSRNAIEAIGGKKEGLLRSHTLMTDGYRRNTVVYSVLSEEWEEIKFRVFAKISNLS